MCFPSLYPAEQSAAFVRPRTLVEGQRYYTLDCQLGGRAALTPVTFIAYTACPAVVIVANSCGIRLRCPREELFGWPAELD